MNILENLGFTDLEFGKRTKVDQMTVIPIIGDDLTDEVARPEYLAFEGNDSYGDMNFINRDENYEAIVPSNLMVISEESAQDHALSGIEVVPGGQTVKNNYACCIQESQGGQLTREGMHEYNVLPLSLRKHCLSKSFRSNTGYDKLWPEIKNFLSGVPGVTDQNQGHLENFFRPFAKKLSDMISEFEPIDNQLGAIIMFNDEIVGVEVMPTEAHWSRHWEWVIRGCYAAELLKLQKTDKIAESSVSMPELPDDPNKAIEVWAAHLKSVEDAVETDLTDIKLAGKTESDTHGQRFRAEMFKTKRGGTKGGGDVVYDTKKNMPIYVSMVT